MVLSAWSQSFLIVFTLLSIRLFPGCGKTTQIPQFILEDSPRESKIIVAQPRRLAATGVASRVALERGESSPGVASVGYAVRGDSKMCASTRLMFCTTGVLLRQLQSKSALENFSHVVIDEVHERHLDTDVLLAILKKTLPSFPKLTVVLMSGKGIKRSGFEFGAKSKNSLLAD